MEEVVTAWKCSYCHKIFDSEEGCRQHEETEKKTLKFTETVQVRQVGLTFQNSSVQYDSWTSIPKTVEDMNTLTLDQVIGGMFSLSGDDSIELCGHYTITSTDTSEQREQEMKDLLKAALTKDLNKIEEQIEDGLFQLSEN